MGVCLPGANNVMSRTHLRQDARALSRSLASSLPLSLSLSRSLSPCSLARSLGVCVHARMRRCGNEAFRNGGTSADVSRSQSHKTGAFRDGVASADVSRCRGRRLQDGPPWNALSGMLCIRMRMRVVVCGGKLLEMTPNTGCLITLC